MNNLPNNNISSVPVLFLAENNAITVKLRPGRLPHATASSLLKTLVEESKRGDYRILKLDFTEIENVSSPILGFCVDIRNRAVALGMSVDMIGVNSQLNEIFKLMRLDRLFNIVNVKNDFIVA